MILVLILSSSSQAPCHPRILGSILIPIPFRLHILEVCLASALQQVQHFSCSGRSSCVGASLEVFESGFDQSHLKCGDLSPQGGQDAEYVFLCQVLLDRVTGARHVLLYDGESANGLGSCRRGALDFVRERSLRSVHEDVIKGATHHQAPAKHALETGRSSIEMASTVPIVRWSAESGLNGY